MESQSQFIRTDRFNQAKQRQSELILLNSHQHPSLYRQETFFFNLKVTLNKEGTANLLLTNYRLVFFDNFKALEFPLGFVIKVIHKILNEKTQTSAIQLFLKFNPTPYQFRLEESDLEKGQSTKNMIQELLWLSPKMPALCQQPKQQDWNPKLLSEQWIRQGVVDCEQRCLVQGLNTIQISIEGYPRLCRLPSEITNRDIEQSAKKRIDKKIPFLTYFFSKSRAMLYRCSQSIYKSVDKKSGLYDAVRKGAKGLLLVYLPQKGKSLIIYQKNDTLMREFQSPKSLFESLNKLMQALELQVTDCQKQDSSVVDYFRLLEESLWYNQIASLLWLASQASAKLEVGFNVILQCVNGRDRVGQLSALVQLILQPYFRTFQGFLLLIQKEFVEVTYEFLRKGDDYANVHFLQFLDAVFQLLSQNRLRFQFNQLLLIELGYQSVVHHSGTFLRNVNKQLKESLKIQNLNKVSKPVRAVLQPDKSQFINVLIKIQKSRLNQTLRCSGFTKNMLFFAGLFQRLRAPLHTLQRGGQSNLQNLIRQNFK